MTIRHGWRALWSVATTQLEISFRYRTAALIVALGAFVGLHINYSLWTAIFNASGSIGSVLESGAVPHILLGQAMIPVLAVSLENVVGNDVRTGGVVTKLTRPVDYQLELLGISLGRTMSTILMRSLPLYVISLVFYGLPLPTPAAATAVLVSLSLSFMINFFVTFLFSSMSFFTVNTWGLQSARLLGISFLSGALVPTELFPPWLGKIVRLLPFRSAAEVPILLYQGAVPVWESLLSQAVWLVVLLALTRGLYLMLKRSVLIQGG